MGDAKGRHGLATYSLHEAQEEGSANSCRLSICSLCRLLKIEVKPYPWFGVRAGQAAINPQPA